MVLQITRLGRFGQWGNQLCQYWAGKALARRCGARLQIPADWIGREVFEIEDDPIDGPALPSCGFDELCPPNRHNYDLLGYFQHPDFFGLYTAEDARAWCRLKPRWADALTSIRPVVRAHMRSYRGYEGVFCVVSESSYIREAAARYMAIMDWVSDYNPQTPVGYPDRAPFLYDFLRLMKSQILFRGNSTFSWTAAILGNVPRVYAPIVTGLHGPNEVEFAEGNHWPMVDLKRNCPEEPGRVSGPYALRETPWPA